MTKRRQIVISMICSCFYGREALRGILDYCTRNADWEIIHHGGESSNAATRTTMAIKRGTSRGVIAQLYDEKLARVIRRAGIPAVDIWSQFPSGLPTMRPNDKAVGRLVADHLHHRGLKNFAWCSTPDEVQDYVDRRRAGYVEALGKLGHECQFFHCGKRWSDWPNELPGVKKWLKSLPKPVGIMCPDDFKARELVMACSSAGLLVPHDVAVVGVDNDSVECSLCRPLLSSVDTRAMTIGYQAAAWLDEMMKRKKLDFRTIEIDPLGVVPRQSSDTFAVEDPILAAAISFISDHATSPISVDDVLRHVVVSRRGLERKFEQLLGRSPREHILRTHMELAKRLLENTRLKLAAVAKQSGFSPGQKFTQLFTEIEKISPTQYRARVQSHESHMGEEHGEWRQ